MDAPIRPLFAAQARRSAAQRYRRWPAPARLAAYLLACLALSAGWCALLFIAFRPGLDIFEMPARYPLPANLYLGGNYLILVGGALWAWRRLQNESLRALGLASERLWRGLAAGTLWGLLSLGGLVLLELGCGWVLADRGAIAHVPVESLLLSALTALFFGFSEELLFRGFVFQTLRRGLGLGGALVGSAWFYATLHFLRFDVHWTQWIVPFSGLFLAGMLLAWAAHRTRSLWFSVGLHSAWVYLFYLTDQHKLLAYPLQHNWLTGGGYPLGGLTGITLLALLYLALAWRFRPAGRA